MAHPSAARERPAFWTIVGILCVIAVAASIRRLLALADPAPGSSSPMAGLDRLFAEKANLTRAHVVAGLVFAAALPVQLSATIRSRFPAVHRWLGRALMIVAVAVGVSGYAMVAQPIGGPLEAGAIAVFGTAFLASVVMAWRAIRGGDIARHRRWVLRAVAIVLGIATTRPIVALFVATSELTGLSPSQFFGIAFWIGFSSTALAGEWYLRRQTHG